MLYKPGNDDMLTAACKRKPRVDCPARMCVNRVSLRYVTGTFKLVWLHEIFPGIVC